MSSPRHEPIDLDQRDPIHQTAHPRDDGDGGGRGPDRAGNQIHTASDPLPQPTPRAAFHLSPHGDGHDHCGGDDPRRGRGRGHRSCAPAAQGKKTQNGDSSPRAPNTDPSTGRKRPRTNRSSHPIPCSDSNGTELGFDFPEEGFRVSSRKGLVGRKMRPPIAGGLYVERRLQVPSMVMKQTMAKKRTMIAIITPNVTTPIAVPSVL